MAYAVSQKVTTRCDFRLLAAMCVKHPMRRWQELVRRDVERIRAVTGENLFDGPLGTFIETDYEDPYAQLVPTDETLRRFYEKNLILDSQRVLLQLRAQLKTQFGTRRNCLCGRRWPSLRHYVVNCKWTEIWAEHAVNMLFNGMIQTIKTSSRRSLVWDAMLTLGIGIPDKKYAAQELKVKSALAKDLKAVITATTKQKTHVASWIRELTVLPSG